MNSINQSKFVTLIKKWSVEELKAFDLWLKSPWCNSNKNLIKLFEKLRKDHPEFKNRKLNKEKLFLQILPKGKFSVRRMNNLLSEAYLVAERFMVFQNFNKDQNLQKDLLTKEFQNRHLEDWFFRDIDKQIERLEQKDIKEWEDHLALFQLHRRLYHHPNQNSSKQPGRQTVVRMGEQIDLIYLLEKAFIINEKIFRNRILKNENHEIDSELKKWHISCEGVKHPALDFYRMRFVYYKENKLEQYFELRELFLKRYEELSENEQKVHFVSLLNDTTLLIRLNLLELSDNVPLYKFGLRTEFLFHKNNLPYLRYVAIIAASNIKNDFNFTFEVIEKYSQKLDIEIQHDAISWAKAHTAYYQKKFDQCLDILLKENFKSIHFKKFNKVLNTQVYFDLYINDSSYEDYLFNYFDSFEKWLLRESRSGGSLQKSYLRFVQISRTIAKTFGDINFAPDSLQNILDKETNIQASKWLKQRIDLVIELKKKATR